MKQLFLALMLTFLVSGCASPPSYFKPASNDQLSPHHHIVSSDLLKPTNHTMVHLNDQQDIIYIQTHGGGGVAVGLLLGPLGVLANANAIESETESDLEQLHGKIQFAPQSALLQSAALHGVNLAAAADNTVKLTPYALVVRDDNEQLLFGTGLIVSATLADGSAYSARYISQADFMVSKAAVALGLSESRQLDLQQALQESLNHSLELYLRDRRGEFTGQELVRFESEFISPRIMFTQQGQLLAATEQRLIVRNFDHVLSVPQHLVKVLSK